MSISTMWAARVDFSAAVCQSRSCIAETTALPSSCASSCCCGSGVLSDGRACGVKATESATSSFRVAWSRMACVQRRLSTGTSSGRNEAEDDRDDDGGSNDGDPVASERCERTDDLDRTIACRASATRSVGEHCARTAATTAETSSATSCGDSRCSSASARKRRWPTDQLELPGVGRPVPPDTRP